MKKRPKEYQKLTAPRRELVEIKHRNRYTLARAKAETDSIEAAKKEQS